MVAVEGGVIFYQQYDTNGNSSIEFFNQTDHSFRKIGQLLIGRAAAVALPVHGLTCHDSEEDTTVNNQEEITTETAEP